MTTQAVRDRNPTAAALTEEPIRRAHLPLSGDLSADERVVRRGGRIHSVTDDSILPKALTLDEAYRAAFFMTDLYFGLESDPDEGLVLFRQYLQSDPARWEDWKHAVRKAIRPGAKPDPLIENLLRD